MKIVSLEQMVWLEDQASLAGISHDTLMENAGLAAAVEIRKRLGQISGEKIVVIIGPGNNGGDGLILSRHLHRWGANVTIYLASSRSMDDPKICQALKYAVSLVDSSVDTNLNILDRLISESNVVVDAVFGTGHSRPLTGRFYDIVCRIKTTKLNSRGKLLVALDVPSGMNGDTGVVDSACPFVDLTICFGFAKRGHFLHPGSERAGELKVVDIGIPETLCSDINIDLLNLQGIKNTMPIRSPNVHKGELGHALVIAGSRNYVGAAYLAAQASARVGPGLVTLAYPKGLYPVLGSKLTEVIHKPLPEDGEGLIDSNAAYVLKGMMAKYTSILIGCGIGVSNGIVEFMDLLLFSKPQITTPVVIDADGLNNLAKIDGWWKRLACPVILTPHPGEMASLTGMPVSQIQQDRIGTVMTWARNWSQIVCLKGAYTVVSGHGKTCYVNPFVNRGLASAGTGDVLAGMVSGFLAQGLTPEDAACLGVFVHGDVGDRVRKQIGATGMLASDMLPLIPTIINDIENN